MERCPHLLDLISKDKSSEEKTLELRLGPPGEENWSINNNDRGDIGGGGRRGEESVLSLRCFSSMKEKQGLSSPWKQAKVPLLQFPSKPASLAVMGRESSSSQPCCTKLIELHTSTQNKAFSPVSANTAVPNTSQKRTAPAPVVGWPPIRSFRKNIASSGFSKPTPELQNVDKVVGEKPVEVSQKSLYVKINMDGIPIGRKVDLKAYDSYEKLSTAVDGLFRHLLAAQRDSPGAGNKNKQEDERVITGVLEGGGEYTLVYEDNEGDRMLVGDVPWHLFVCTVKRLRVLKSSELSSLSLGSGKADMMKVNSAVK